MNPYQKAVEDFHRGTGQTVGETPKLRDRELRAKLIMEEAVETVAALGFAAEGSIANTDWNSDTIATFRKAYAEPDILDTIDGVCDLIYVALGTMVAAGVDLDPFFAEVQRANMDKLKGPKRADGKQLKPEGWRGPDHLPILEILEAEGDYLHPWEEGYPHDEVSPAEVRHERLLYGLPNHDFPDHGQA